VDIYTKKMDDILYSLPINPTYGWNSLEFNGASMKGHGYELSVSGEVLKYKDFRWRSSFNLSYNTNEVTDSRFSKPTSYSMVASSTPIVGLPVDYMYAYRWAGLDATGQSQIYNSKGEVISSTVNSTSLAFSDLKNMGRTTPPYFGGFTNNFSYKSFTLGVQISYAMGHVFRRSSVDNYPQFAGSYTGVIGCQKDLAKRWQESGDEKTTDVPGLSNLSYNSVSRYKYSSVLVESGSNIRLRQISLGYNVPSKLLSKTPIKSASASFSVRNLGLLWKKNKAGVDPDYVATNTYTNLPPAKSFFFTINLSF